MDYEKSFQGFVQISHPNQTKGFWTTDQWLEEWGRTKEGTIERMIEIAKELNRQDIVEVLRKLCLREELKKLSSSELEELKKNLDQKKSIDELVNDWKPPEIGEALQKIGQEVVAQHIFTLYDE